MKWPCPRRWRTLRNTSQPRLYLDKADLLAPLPQRLHEAVDAVARQAKDHLDRHHRLPMNQKARDLMTGAPLAVDAKQLKELGL